MVYIVKYNFRTVCDTVTPNKFWDKTLTSNLPLSSAKSPDKENPTTTNAHPPASSTPVPKRTTSVLYFKVH